MYTRILRAFAALATAALILTGMPAPAAARMPSSDVALWTRDSAVIVQVADAAHMAGVRAALEARGASITKTFRWSAYLVGIPAESDQAQFAATLKSIPGVKYAQGNSILRATALTSTNDPLFSRQWGLGDIGAPAAWAQTEGSGVSVAIIDTGIDATQPDLAGQVVLFRNYVTPGASAADDEGHGTHVAGIVAAIRNNGIEGSGTAPKAQLYAFKALDANGSGDDASVAAAIRDAVDLTPCRIISMSLGGPGSRGGDQVLASAVAYAESKGAIVIAAAGNDGVTTASYPAALPGVVGVGAVDSSNNLANFSNYGTANLDVVAPGVNILSTVRGTSTATWSGTSMATPFVSGAAALVWAAHPGLSAAQVIALLESTAVDLGTTGVDQSYGHGLVRADLALATFATPPPPTPDPTTTPTPDPTGTPDPTVTVPPAPVPRTATAISLYLSKATVRLTATTTLSGWLRPGALNDAVRVYVKGPGAKVWSLKTIRRTSVVSGDGAKWSYVLKPTKRGTYKLRVWFLSTADRKASVSKTLSLRVL